PERQTPFPRGRRLTAVHGGRSTSEGRGGGARCGCRRACRRRGRGKGGGRRGAPRIGRARRRRHREGRVQRGRVGEVEHVLERVRVLVAVGQELRAEEAFLDEGEQGGVVADRVGDVTRLREGRDRDERNADAELIEVGAVRRIGPRRRERRADGERFG